MNNNAAVKFFEQIKKQYPLDEHGNIDYNFLFQPNNSPAFMYLCSKLPESFARASDIFQIPYDFYYHDKDKTYGDIMFSKMINGDFSDILRFEKLYPFLQVIAFVLNKNKEKYHRIVNQAYWKNIDNQPERMKKDIEKYRDIYNQIIQNDGMFTYHGGLYQSKAIENLLRKANDDEKELLTFAYHITKNYEGIKSGEWLRDNENNLRTTQNFKNNVERKLRELEEKLEIVNKRLLKYNAITSIVKKKQKESDLKARDLLQNEIIKNKKSLDTILARLIIQEDQSEVYQKHQNNFNQVIIDEIVPIFKTNFENNVDKDIINELIDYLFSKDNLDEYGRDPIIYLSRRLEVFTKVSFDDYIKGFKNSINTLMKLPDIFLSFEKLETKDLYSFLNIARNDLITIPHDDYHQEVSMDFRKHDLSGINDNITTIRYQDINDCMDLLNSQFLDLMREDDIEEYVKKASRIWYEFIIIHPYADGNGRTGRYLLNVLLAHKDILIPSLYSSLEGQYNLIRTLDKYGVIGHDYNKVGEIMLERIRNVAIDLTGQNRLRKNNKNDAENEEKTHKM